MSTQYTYSQEVTRISVMICVVQRYRYVEINIRVSFNKFYINNIVSYLLHIEVGLQDDL